MSFTVPSKKPYQKKKIKNLYLNRLPEFLFGALNNGVVTKSVHRQVRQKPSHLFVHSVTP